MQVIQESRAAHKRILEYAHCDFLLCVPGNKFYDAVCNIAAIHGYVYVLELFDLENSTIKDAIGDVFSSVEHDLRELPPSECFFRAGRLGLELCTHRNLEEEKLEALTWFKEGLWPYFTTPLQRTRSRVSLEEVAFLTPDDETASSDAINLCLTCGEDMGRFYCLWFYVCGFF